MRYFLRLAYRGEPFHGWQSQPNAISVQQTVEEALSTALRVPVAIVGAGRTDAGVNAREMFAHFDVDRPVDDPRRLLLSLNRLCGRDIALYDLLPVKVDAHARFDAVRREYKYFVTLRKSPFLYPLSWQAPPSLDFDAMNEAAKILLDTDDFTSFAKLHSDAKTNICRVTVAQWDEVAPGVRAFTIAADPDFHPTDDTRVVVDYLPDEPVAIVSGAETNLKITTLEDIPTAERIAEEILGRDPKEEARARMHALLAQAAGQMHR